MKVKATYSRVNPFICDAENVIQSLKQPVNIEHTKHRKMLSIAPFCSSNDDITTNIKHKGETNSLRN